MKIKLKHLLITLSLILAGVQSTLADPPGPPNPGGDPGTGGGVPVGAPIDDGIFVLLALAVFYAGYKFYEIRRNKARSIDAKAE